MTRHALVLAAGLALAAVVVAGDDRTNSNAPSPVQGFLYGTVETTTGKSYTGILRWDDEEAFWDDVFHASKDELPYLDYAEDHEADDDATWWQRMVHTIGGDLGMHRQVRVVAIRFGDLSGLRPVGAHDAVLILRDGRELEVGGYANDAGSTVVVGDRELGVVEVPWRRIEAVTFAATPAEADPGAHRLRGTVTTTAGKLEGSIQWDSEECLSTDILDGDSDEGRLKLEMGRIRSIERRDRRSARVTLKDGTTHVLSGTNDVNHDIRGILVEDPRYGRVEVPWDEFEGVVFDDAGGSGPAYDDFAPARHLSGTVAVRGGDRLEGELVFDLDEEWSWEMLDGENGNVDYAVPFAMVASLEPGASGTLVRLRSGEELPLEDSHDVDRDNDGVVVLGRGGDEPVYVPWRKVERIDFE